MQDSSTIQSYHIPNLKDSQYETYSHPTYRDVAKEHKGTLMGLGVVLLLTLFCTIGTALIQVEAAIMFGILLIAIVCVVFSNAETAMHRLIIKRGNEVEYWAARWFDINVKEEVFKATGYLITDRPRGNHFSALSPSGQKVRVALIGFHEGDSWLYVPGVGGYTIDPKGVTMKVIQ